MSGNVLHLWIYKISKCTQELTGARLVPAGRARRADREAGGVAEAASGARRARDRARLGVGRSGAVEAERQT